MVLVWQIAVDSPNFPPAKLSRYTVLNIGIIDRNPSILLLFFFPAILLNFTYTILCSKFCPLKNIHLPEVYIKNLIIFIKHITNLN